MVTCTTPVQYQASQHSIMDEIGTHEPGILIEELLSADGFLGDKVIFKGVSSHRLITLHLIVPHP